MYRMDCAIRATSLGNHLENRLIKRSPPCNCDKKKNSPQQVEIRAVSGAAIPLAARVGRSRRITLKSAAYVFRSKCKGCVYAAAAATAADGLPCLWRPQTRPMKSRKDYNFGTVFDSFLVKFANKCDSSYSYRIQNSKFTDKLSKFSDLLGVTV